MAGRFAPACMERLIARKILRAILIITCVSFSLALSLSLSLSLGNDRDSRFMVAATAFIADFISAIINPRRSRYVAAAYVRRPAFSALL